MRISDWSSDVCSSDLNAPAASASCITARRFAVLPLREEHACRNRKRWEIPLLRLRRAPSGRQRPLQGHKGTSRSEEHTSELQSLMRISYAVFCLKKKKTHNSKTITKTKRNKIDIK